MDLKALQIALQQLETEKGVSKDKIILTIEDALSAAYKKITAKKARSSMPNSIRKTAKCRLPR